MEIDERMELVSDRAALLELLTDGGLEPRTIETRADASRSTINRALRTLVDAGLVENTGGRYRLTATGRIALEQYRRYRAAWEDLDEAAPLLARLPPDTTVTRAVTSGCAVVCATDETPYRPDQRLTETLRGADEVRAALPVVADPQWIRELYEHVVTEANEASLVVDDGVADRLVENFPQRLRRMADTGRFSLATGAPSRLGVVLTERTDGATATVVVYGDEGTVAGLLQNDRDDAVEWARARLDAADADASDVTDRLYSARDGGVRTRSPADATTVPVDLEREGFVELTREYFVTRETAAPTTAWRTGLELPEVHTGYAVERRTEDGEPLTERLLAALRNGDHQLVVGPPGAGKSTALKRVADEWYARDLGPVLYREGGHDRPVESVDALVDHARTRDGRTLIVVEDAVRPDANATFEAAARLGEEAVVLMDAREREWRDPPDDAPDSDAAVTVRTMPPLTAADYERFRDHVERTAGEPVGLSTDQLVDDGRRRESAPGAVVSLVHRLSLAADPLSDRETTLEADAASVYDRLAAAGELALDLGVLVNLLNAAGLPVRPAFLYAAGDAGDADDAVPAADGGSVEAVVETLSGRVLFGVDGDRYRTVHEAWSAAFLETVLERGEAAEARQRVDRTVSGVLALADDPERRERVRAATGRGLPDRLASDPAAWADALLEALLRFGEERPKVAPLFGDASGPTLAPTAPCDSVTRGECAARSAWMFATAGDYDTARAIPIDLVPEETASRCRLLGARAEAQLRQGDVDEARETAERRLDLAVELDADRHRREALRTLGRIDYEVRDDESARDHAREALELARAADDRRMEAAALDLLGRIEFNRSAYDEARRYHERSLAINREIGARKRISASLTGLGIVAIKQGDYEEARDHLKRSLDIKRTLGLREGEALVLGNLGVVCKRQGDYDRAETYFRESKTVKEETGDREGVATSLRNLWNLAFLRGEYGAAREYEHREIEIRRGIDHRWGEGIGLNNLGLVERRQAEYDRAREHLERALEIEREADDGIGVAETITELAVLDARQGDVRGARERFDEAIDRYEDLGAPKGEATARIERAHLHRLTGDDAAAEAGYERARDLAADLGDPRLRARALTGLAALARERGATDAAHEKVTEARSLFEDRDLRPGTARTRLELARLALAEDDPQGARDHARAAREAFAEMGNEYQVARCDRVLGRVADATGDTATAVDRLEGALETFETLEATPAAVDALRDLVETVADDGRRRDCCVRAVELLDGASWDAGGRREWFRDACPDAATT